MARAKDSLKVSEIRKMNDVRDILHTHANFIDIHEKQISFLKEKTELLNEQREQQQLRIVTVENDHTHTRQLIENINSTLKDFTVEIKNGIKDIVSEISSLKESRNRNSAIIDFLKPILLLLIGGGISYFFAVM